MFLRMPLLIPVLKTTKYQCTSSWFSTGGQRLLSISLSLSSFVLLFQGHGLEVDAKGPDHLEGRVVVLIDEQAGQHARAEQVLDREVVEIRVVRLLLRRLEAHDVDDRRRAADEDDLEEGVVQRRKVPEEVEITAGEDDRVELLRAQRDASAALALDDLEEQNDEGQDVAHVTQEAEDIHGCAAATPLASRLVRARVCLRGREPYQA